jgi:DHA1 family multidrug resistance protein-like MFS transporter
LPGLRSPFTTRWQRTLWIAFFAQTITSVGFSSIFPFLPLYVEELGSAYGISVELLSGLVFSVQGITMAIASPIWGMLADRFGRKVMVERALFGGTILLGWMAFARSAEELVLLRAVQGLVTGTISATYALVAAEVPREHSGFAMGMLQVGSGVGVALGPLLGGAIADAFSYSAAFYVTAAMLLLAGILVVVGIQEDFHPLTLSSEQKRPSWLGRWRAIFRTPGMSQAYSLRFLGNLGQSLMLPIMPLFVAALVTDESQINTFTGLVVGVASATTTLSAVYLGRLGDRVGHRRIVIGSSLLAALFYLPQTFATEGWQILALQGLVGLAMGGILPSVTALLARFSRPGDEGSVYGLDNSIVAGARAAAPLLGAWAAVAFGMRSAFAFSAALFAITALVAITALPREKEYPQMNADRKSNQSTDKTDGTDEHG